MPKELPRYNPYLPEGPLTCGNPWTRKSCLGGRSAVLKGMWIGSHWVIADHYMAKDVGARVWTMLDGRTGKPVKLPVKGFPDLTYRADLITLGSYLLVWDSPAYPDVACYKLIEE